MAGGSSFSITSAKHSEEGAAEIGRRSGDGGRRHGLYARSGLSAPSSRSGRRDPGWGVVGTKRPLILAGPPRRGRAGRGDVGPWLFGEARPSRSPRRASRERRLRRPIGCRLSAVLGCGWIPKAKLGPGSSSPPDGMGGGKRQASPFSRQRFAVELSNLTRIAHVRAARFPRSGAGQRR